MRDIISELNQEIYESLTEEGQKLMDEEFENLVEYRTDGYAELIEYMGQVIWDSENYPDIFISIGGGPNNFCIIDEGKPTEKTIPIIDYLKMKIEEKKDQIWTLIKGTI